MSAGPGTRVHTTVIHSTPSSFIPTTPTSPCLHLQVNVFVLLSVVCVLLNLAGFILCCQGAQLVSSMTSCRLVRMLHMSVHVVLVVLSVESVFFHRGLSHTSLCFLYKQKLAP